MSQKPDSKLLRRLYVEEDTIPAEPEKQGMIEIMIEMLRVPDPELYLKMTRSLIRLGSQAVPALINALGDEEEQVWRLASASLVKIGEPAVQPLVAALEHPNEQIRLLAAAALNKLGRPRADEPGHALMLSEYRKLLRIQREKGHRLINAGR